MASCPTFSARRVRQSAEPQENGLQWLIWEHASEHLVAVTQQAVRLPASWASEPCSAGLQDARPDQQAAGRGAEERTHSPAQRQSQASDLENATERFLNVTDLKVDPFNLSLRLTDERWPAGRQASSASSWKGR